MGAPTILSTEDEEILVNWIQKSADAGFPISKKNFLHSVKKLTDELGKQFPGKGNLPGKKWLSSFLNRHPDVSFRTSQNLTSSRASVTKKNLEDWFKEVYDYLEKKNLTDCLKDPNKVFNGDESAFFLSPKGDKVLARKGDKTVYNKIGSNEKECETVMITGNAAGDLAPPLVIFQYQRLPYEIAQNLPIGWGIGTSDSGWNTSDVFYCYMANVFYPWAKQNKDIRFPIIFFLDGHASHLSYHLSKFCEEHDIILVALYPNSTQYMQPMDVAVFHTLKQAWIEKVNDWRIKNQQAVLTKVNFAKVLKEALDEKVTDKILRNGFRKCGLYPWDPSVVNNIFDKISKSSSHSESSAIVNKNDYELKIIEKYIPVEKLDMFKSEKKEVWTGAMEDKSLYEVWCKIKGKNGIENITSETQEKTGSQEETGSSSDIREEAGSSFQSENAVEVGENSQSQNVRESMSSSLNKDNSAANANVANENSVQHYTPEKDHSYSIPSPFKKSLVWPGTPKKKVTKRKKEKIPSVVVSEEWQAYHEKIREKKKQAEEEKIRKKAEREAKKKQKEEAKKKKEERLQKKNQKKNPRRKKKVISSSDESEVSDISHCYESELEGFVSISDMSDEENISIEKPRCPERAGPVRYGLRNRNAD